MFLEKKVSFKSEVKQAWKHAWSFRAFRIQAVITFIVVTSFSVIFNRFFDFVESREGTLLKDYVLEYLPSYNVSWIIFFFLYSGIILGIYSHLHHPKTILLIFQTYVLVTLIRICTITVLPLEPPVGYIPLREPLVQFFTNGGKIISKDLFFSGHMSTILSLYYSSHRKYLKTYLLFSSIMIALMVLIQHVHYTVDVIVAVPATLLTFRFCKSTLAGKTY